MLGLRFCVGFPLVAEHGAHSSCGAWSSHHHGFSCWGAQALGSTGFSSCDTPAKLLHCMWGLPGQGIGPMSPAFLGRFFTTEALGKPAAYFSRLLPLWCLPALLLFTKGRTKIWIRCWDHWLLILGKLLHWHSLPMRSLTHSSIHSLLCVLKFYNQGLLWSCRGHRAGKAGHLSSLWGEWMHFWGALEPWNSPCYPETPVPLWCVSTPQASCELSPIPGFDHSNQLGNIWTPGLLGVLDLK